MTGGAGPTGGERRLEGRRCIECHMSIGHLKQFSASVTELNNLERMFSDVVKDSVRTAAGEGTAAQTRNAGSWLP